MSTRRANVWQAAVDAAAEAAEAAEEVAMADAAVTSVRPRRLTARTRTIMAKDRARNRRTQKAKPKVMANAEDATGVTSGVMLMGTPIDYLGRRH